MSRSRRRQPGGAYVSRSWRHTALQFKGEVTQSRMLTWFPDWLQVGYTRSMLAAWLLAPQTRRIGIVGLGGGSQAKFCHRYLPWTDIEAIESDAGVLALRDEFRIPPDGERFRVVHADAARLLRQRHAAYDLLLLDAYDEHGIPVALSTRDFYRDCHASLTEGGAMACNLYASDTAAHLAHLRHCFDGRVLALDEPGMSNTVAFAWRGEVGDTDPQPLLQRLPWLARRQLRPGMLRLQTALRR
ncbi:transferase [Pseudoxanthomonas kalamensis DSM 18571]|uniref:fused MFS/spermidine synthase n=1 Tax=Pseudoxanthomonas kalamensis TaxID=289483 RepID=UPI0013915E09|nr:fused MFS/spermidine synthase [Pseudoxanthomonas kalamensis]KAF1710580.1 transferase [Pseudoxanthomonas kalamensis DSM 18571]